MPDFSTPPAREEFAKWVHDALNRLYDSPYLQKHPLANLLAREDDSARLQLSQHLRRVLLDAIAAMRPNSGVPAQSPDWRGYRILELRYIEGMSPDEVMNELALGRSQYFRDQARVLELLTDVLWNRWQEMRVADAPTLAATADAREKLVHSETERLRAHATWEATDVKEMLEELRGVVESLANAKHVSVHLEPLHHLTVPNADRVMLRQALLSLIACALDVARAGRVDVGCFEYGEEMGIQVIASGSAGTASDSGAGVDHGKDLDICSQLMAAMGGRLRLETESSEHWEARLAWPTSQPRVLLVVDDNRSFADLFRRYLAGHGWQVVGAGNGAEARKLIDEMSPTLIVLDVMMPKEDGWEFLLALKSSEQTRSIPVIIASVLSEPQLAVALGAEAYLAKPVTQEALLRAVAAWN